MPALTYWFRNSISAAVARCMTLACWIARKSICNKFCKRWAAQLIRPACDCSGTKLRFRLSR